MPACPVGASTRPPPRAGDGLAGTSRLSRVAGYRRRLLPTARRRSVRPVWWRDAPLPGIMRACAATRNATATGVRAVSSASASPKVDRVVTLGDGRRIAYAEWGRTDGRPIVLFHGMPGSRLFCPDEKETERAGVRLITIDRPGYGRSSPHLDGRCSIGPGTTSNGLSWSSWRRARLLAGRAAVPTRWRVQCSDPRA